MTLFTSGCAALRTPKRLLAVGPALASVLPLGGALRGQASQRAVAPGDSVSAAKRLTSATHVVVTSAAPAPRALPPGDDRIVSFAFGHSDPVVRCTVLRACVVELEPGESLVDEPISGDQERWIIGRARTGAGGGSTLIIVKPKACDISTNLVLSTDRRIYDLDLESPSCKGAGTNPKQSYTRHIRFEYPDDRNKGVAARGERESRGVADATPAARDSGEVAAREVPFRDSSSFNRNYHVVRHRRGPFGLFGRKPIDFPWMPAAIRDDSAHVYIVMPAAAKQHAAPILYSVEDDGSRTMMNFTTRDSVIVTDRVFRRGMFVLASGEREQRLEFENRSWGKAPATAGRR